MPLADDEMLLLRVWGRYVDLFTQNRAAWRIQRRSVVIERSITERSRSKFREGWIAARRDGAYAIEFLRREVGLCS